MNILLAHFLARDLNKNYDLNDLVYAEIWRSHSVLFRRYSRIGSCMYDPNAEFTRIT